MRGRAGQRLGFSLAEVLVVLAISTVIMVLLALMSRTAMWEISHSSGRIEVVRTGRMAINNIQRYLLAVSSPSQIFYQNGTPVTAPIYHPLETEIVDPSATNNPSPVSKIRFFSARDFFDDSTPRRLARDLQDAGGYFAYEIAAIPGANNQGIDIVARRLQPQPLGAVNPLPVNIDTTVKPTYLGKRLGVPNPGNPGQYQDGLVVSRLNHESAIHIEVNVSSDLISDSYNRNKLEDSTPLRIRMETIYQPPFFNLNRN